MALTYQEEADVVRLVAAAMSQSAQLKHLAQLIKAKNAAAMATHNPANNGETAIKRIAGRRPAIYNMLNAALNDSSPLPGGATPRNHLVDAALDSTFTNFAGLLNLVWNQADWSVPPDHPVSDALNDLG